MANTTSSDKSSAGRAQQEAIEPLVPHNSREEVDLSPPPPKKPHEPEVIEPMIPHKTR